MLVFDEKKYAEKLLKNRNFETYRQRDVERYILMRYLVSEGLDFDEIKGRLSRFPLIGCEYLDKKTVDTIYKKILDKATSCELVTGIKVTIYKEEMEIINSLSCDDVKGLLFVLLVYYKWAISQPYLYFYSRKNNVKMALVNDKDCWKLANLMKLRVLDRYKLCNELLSKGLYQEDNFKSHNYFYLPFAKDSGEVAFEISNYENLLGELKFYNDKDNYKRCSICGVVIKKTRSPKKYCSDCAYKEKRKYDKIGKTQIEKAPIK